ncbi:alpha/beta fold hydrolase [Streptomyces tropicalis]|uniref:Alpha/beta hydrolase n=1 Tax=Streptomyces tropicalis TaxID=3034234 RepID=A0ABT6A2U0_9ACTN|nr:alpha/beta hydrolase [Streptomyces tropicalis]MDF3298966.1 alpha/beta hydrolase [Streptomyces tropicalis]
MTHLVLVAGAWLGGRAWDGVVPGLREAGLEPRPLTLSGLAEKKGTPAGLRTHVEDVVGLVEGEDLRDVVLVGHSYSGVPVGMAAERIGDRLRRVVFVDANVPADGASFLDAFPSAHVRRAIAEHGGAWPPPPPGDFAGQGLSEQQIDRIVTEGTPHPGASLTEPAELRRPLGELPATYVKCLLDGPDPAPAVAALTSGGSWELVRMDTGHWPMFSQPDALARILAEAAAL